MKQILKFKTVQSDFPIDEMWGSYIFSYIFLFLLENELYDNDATLLKIDKSKITNLQERVSCSLRDLFKVSYNDPSIGELQKHPTRFEKLLFEGKKYKVNYRMTVSGRIAYAIYCLINFIEEAKLKDSDIYIECK